MSTGVPIGSRRAEKDVERARPRRKSRNAFLRWCIVAVNAEALLCRNRQLRAPKVRKKQRKVRGEGCTEWERGGNCEKQTRSRCEQRGARGTPCQRVHSVRTELLGYFDSVGRLCWIRAFSLCWIVCPLKPTELCNFSAPPTLILHSRTWHINTQTQYTVPGNTAVRCQPVVVGV